MIGWEAARANARPALIIQAIMLALLVAYYTNPATADWLEKVAEFKRVHGVGFVVAASVTAGALIPEFFFVLFFQRGRPHLRNLRNLLFTIPVWGFDGSLVDLLYRSEAHWLGDVVTLPVVLGENLHRPVRLQRPFRRPVRRPDLRVEKQRYFDASSARSLHLEALSRQDFPDVAGDLGGLDSVDGYHLFAPARTPVSAVRPRAFVLGPAADLHDEPLRRKNQSRCAARSRCD